ncbi:MAG: PaaI family thioesterase [Mariprofundaceae bacterium]
MQTDRQEHYQKLERMYLGAPCNDNYRPRLKIGEGRAEVVIPVKKELFHAAGAVHGSVYFKALDDAAFFAANSLVEDVFVLATSFNLYLTRPVSSGLMRAVGRVVNTTKSQMIAESILYDADGREIARGSGTFLRSKITLIEEIGYR